MRLSDFHPDDVEVVQPRLSHFDPNEISIVTHPPSAPTSPPSQTESLARGAAQGITLDHAPVVVGGVEAGLDKLHGSDQTFGELYRQHRDESQHNFDVAHDTNPWSYRAGEFTGMMPLGMLKGSGLVKSVAMGAALGQGDSKADLTKGEFGQTGLDTVVGGTVGAATHGIGEVFAPKISSVVGTAKKMVNAGGKKLLSTLSRVPTESIDARLAGRAQDNAASYSVLAEKMKDSLGDLSDQINDDSKRAWDRLNPISDPTFGGYDKNVLNREIDDVRRGLRINGKGPSKNNLSVLIGIP